MTAARTFTAPHPAPTADLVEAYTLATAPLRIDKDAGVIFDVKLGGLESPNTHGMPGVTKGTKYKASAYQGALPLYEGTKVYPKHAPRGKAPDRGPFEYIGVIREARWDAGTNTPRGNFHYVKSHPNAPQLIEDVERGMGGFGFSHHIPPGGFRGKVEDGWLVVEAISQIKSVDLVDDPATTRNLWESHQMTDPTLKSVLLAWVEDKSDAHKAVAKALLEDDAAGGYADAPMDAPADGGDGADQSPEDELWQGFLSAIMAIINGDGSAADKAKQIGKYLKAHEKLTKGPGDGSAGDAADDDSAKESREHRELRAKVACLEAGIKEPSPVLLKSLAALDTEADRKALIEQTRAAQQPPKRPTSSAPRPAPRKPLQEAAVPTGDAFRRSING